MNKQTHFKIRLLSALSVFLSAVTSAVHVGVIFTFKSRHPQVRVAFPRQGHGAGLPGRLEWRHGWGRV